MTTGYAWLMAGCSTGILQRQATTDIFKENLLYAVLHLLFFLCVCLLVNRPWLADLPKQSYAIPSVLNITETSGGRKGSVGITTSLPIDIAF